MRGNKSKRPKKKKNEEKSSPLIIIDEGAGLIFESEKDLFNYFETGIETLEKDYAEHRMENDFTDDEQIDLEKHLDETLESPDEVWVSQEIFEEHNLHCFIKTIETDAEKFYYVAIAYVSGEDQYPNFILIHFCTRFNEFVDRYRTGECVYNRRVEMVQQGALEGDALGEGDPLSLGLYESMMKVRSDKDVAQDKFKDFLNLREETIETADEIWRKTDHAGNILVCFIKEFPDHEIKDLFYIAVTQEDPQSSVHSLLFSFPTIDKGLLDRYRQGENLQAEEISQESSH